MGDGQEVASQRLALSRPLTPSVSPTTRAFQASFPGSGCGGLGLGPFFPELLLSAVPPPPLPGRPWTCSPKAPCPVALLFSPTAEPAGSQAAQGKTPVGELGTPPAGPPTLPPGCTGCCFSAPDLLRGVPPQPSPSLTLRTAGAARPGSFLSSTHFPCCPSPPCLGWSHGLQPPHRNAFILEQLVWPLFPGEAASVKAVEPAPS